MTHNNQSYKLKLTHNYKQCYKALGKVPAKILIDFDLSPLRFSYWNRTRIH